MAPPTGVWPRPRARVARLEFLPARNRSVARLHGFSPAGAARFPPRRSVT